MAAVKGMKEFVHLPQYDSISIKPKEQLGKIPARMSCGSSST